MPIYRCKVYRQEPDGTHALIDTLDFDPAPPATLGWVAPTAGVYVYLWSRGATGVEDIQAPGVVGLYRATAKARAELLGFVVTEVPGSFPTVPIDYVASQVPVQRDWNPAASPMTLNIGS